MFEAEYNLYTNIIYSSLRWHYFVSKYKMILSISFDIQEHLTERFWNVEGVEKHQLKWLKFYINSFFMGQLYILGLISQSPIIKTSQTYLWLCPISRVFKFVTGQWNFQQTDCVGSLGCSHDRSKSNYNFNKITFYVWGRRQSVHRYHVFILALI